MRIQIGDNLFLKSDQFAFQVVTVIKEKQQGKMVDRDLRLSGYHRHAQDAVRSYIERHIKSCDATTIDELRRVAEEISEMIAPVVEQLESIPPIVFVVHD